MAAVTLKQQPFYPLVDWVQLKNLFGITGCLFVGIAADRGLSRLFQQSDMLRKVLKGALDGGARLFQQIEFTLPANQFDPTEEVIAVELQRLLYVLRQLFFALSVENVFRYPLVVMLSLFNDMVEHQCAL